MLAQIIAQPSGVKQIVCFSVQRPQHAQLEPSSVSTLHDSKTVVSLLLNLLFVEDPYHIVSGNLSSGCIRQLTKRYK